MELISGNFAGGFLEILLEISLVISMEKTSDF
jgi:hypothetical protein